MCQTLHVDSLVYRFSPRGKQIGPFTFTADCGQIWAVLGNNGAGKSTLFSMLAGSRRHSGGSLQVTGSVEYVEQSMSIPGRVTVQQLLEYLALLKKIPKADRTNAIEQCLNAVDLWDLRTSRVKSLSGGQQRRLVVGQSLMTQPDLLLLDEPTAGLDIDQRAKVRIALEHAAVNRVVLISSHIIEDLAGLATHILHVRNGRQVFAGSANEYFHTAEDSVINTNDSAVWTTKFQAWNGGEAI